MSNAAKGEVNKGKTPIGVVEKRVGTTPILLKCRGHGHCVVVCPSNGLHFCIEESKPKSEANLKKVEID